MTDPLSPAQIAGYVAFALGILAFLQRSDRRLKLFNATQSLVYALHFVMLGNAPASLTALLSSTRSFLALTYRSLVLAAVLVAANIAVGLRFASTPAGWLPVGASSLATVGIFVLRGIALRSVLLICTLLWLANNIISGSIGGTLLEVTVASLNLYTMYRLWRRPVKS